MFCRKDFISFLKDEIPEKFILFAFEVCLCKKIVNEFAVIRK